MHDELYFPSDRPNFPPASNDEIEAIVNRNPSSAFDSIERFLEKAPKKTIDPAFSKFLLEKRGIKVGNRYHYNPTIPTVECEMN